MASPTQWTWIWANSGRWWRTEEPGVMQGHGVTKSWIQPNDWTTTYPWLGTKRPQFPIASLLRRGPWQNLKGIKKRGKLYLCIDTHSGNGGVGLLGGPVVKALCFPAVGMGSIPGWGSKTPHATQLGKKKRGKSQLHLHTISWTLHKKCLDIRIQQILHNFR